MRSRHLAVTTLQSSSTQQHLAGGTSLCCDTLQSSPASCTLQYSTTALAAANSFAHIRACACSCLSHNTTPHPYIHLQHSHQQIYDLESNYFNAEHSQTGNVLKVGRCGCVFMNTKD